MMCFVARLEWLLKGESEPKENRGDLNSLADIMRCKIDGFIASHVQMAGHFTLKHPDKDYAENTEILGNSDADLKVLGFRPSIEYYRARIRGVLGVRTPFDFERTVRKRSR